mgnify:FL=1
MPATDYFTQEWVPSERDNLVREAINRHLKRDDWTLQEVGALGLVNTHLPDGREVLSVGGTPVLEFLPLSYSQDEVRGRHMLTASRQYRFLVGESA